MSASTIELPRIRRPPPLAAVRFFTEEDAPTSPEDPSDPFPHTTSYADELLTIQPQWRRELFQLMEQATSSKAAFFLNMFLTFLILFSALVTVIETVPAVHSISTRVWFGVETTVVILFTVEYISRCLAWSTTWSSLFYWMISFYGVIDLLSVLPYYLELLLQQDTSVYFRFSILRMFRLLRVFRPFRYNHTILLTIEVMYLSVRRSQHALFAIGFFVVMILTVFSTLLYFAERGTWDDLLGTFINNDGDPSQFSSIPAAAWFVLVTITTVGYGEITPRSFLGRLITLPILVFGLLLITLPSFVLGREFSSVWEKMMRDRREDDPSFNEQHEHADSPYTPVDERRRRAAERGDLRVEQLPQSASFSPGGGAMHTGMGTGMGTGTYPPPPRTPATGRDLSNMKLAQNQTELSRQIEDLASTVEIQGRLLERLLEKLDGGRTTSGAPGGGAGNAGLRARGSLDKGDRGPR
ncbi:voltage-gated potassium channel [Pholiota conissans]|uniref:Voltage-gated potassium channel n=1 Tax=Pholiota conissans TaxID=109636 RepID=A0A9P5YT65_9AGAR|nr:voltage-gated potassium channel [Pholiota conissans]